MTACTRMPPSTTPATVADAKIQVQHGDLKFLSIHAGDLKENIRDRARGLRDVVKGRIKEVSLVLAGANSGAYIDQVNLAHADDGELYLDEAIIFFGDASEISLEHAATKEVEENESLEDVLATLNEKQTMAVDYLLSQLLTNSNELKQSDPSLEDDDEDELDDDEDSEDDDTDDDATDEDSDSEDEDDASHWMIPMPSSTTTSPRRITA